MGDNTVIRVNHTMTNSVAQLDCLVYCQEFYK